VSSSEPTEAEGHGKRRFGEGIEIAEAVLLALVAIATAWSGYQAARWDGRETELYGQSSRLRITATMAQTAAGQQQLYDALTLNGWLEATLSGNHRVAAAYSARFRPEYRPAFRAWLATNPLRNPAAPLGPAYMPEYRNANAARAVALEQQATNRFDAGTHARAIADKYVRTTVLLATVLFLIALSQRFSFMPVRVGLIGVSLLILAFAIGSLASYPRH
jgi:hypothetical protein